MRVFLSGMPELRLGLNDKVLFENTGREFSIICPFQSIQEGPSNESCIVLCHALYPVVTSYKLEKPEKLFANAI